MAVVTAAVALMGFWLKVADKHPRTVLTLLVVSGGLTVVGLLAAVAGKVAELGKQRMTADAQWRDAVGELLSECPGGGLPRLSEVTDAQLGATPTRYTRQGRAPYVDRPSVDARIRTALGVGGPPFPFVVVWGASKSGKSRTAVQAARAVFGAVGPLVVLARNGEALALLTKLDPPLPVAPVPGVVWLDDLTVADLGALTSTVLDWWAQRAVILSTITAERYQEIRYSGSDVTATARAALHQATAIEQPFQMTDAEIAQATALYPDEHFAGSVAETLIGGTICSPNTELGRTRTRMVSDWYRPPWTPAGPGLTAQSGKPNCMPCTRCAYASTWNPPQPDTPTGWRGQSNPSPPKWPSSSVPTRTAGVGDPGLRRSRRLRATRTHPRRGRTVGAGPSVPRSIFHTGAGLRSSPRVDRRRWGGTHRRSQRAGHVEILAEGGPSALVDPQLGCVVADQVEILAEGGPSALAPGDQASRATGSSG